MNNDRRYVGLLADISHWLRVAERFCMLYELGAR